MTSPEKLSDFDYELPAELIAQKPRAERDASRLLHLTPEGIVRHHIFRDLPGLLEPGDLLVLNDTKVFPARLFGRRSSGGGIELLLLEEMEERTWRALARPARKLGAGVRLEFGDGKLTGEILAEEPEGRRVVRFDFEGEWDALLDELGSTPVPPYIERSRHEGAPDCEELRTRERYQTVYAEDRGSVAAPTAGLHFTDRAFRALELRGVRTAMLTLHVGYATFEPIRSEAIAEHRMGVERYSIPAETAERIRATHRAGRRVVAVGTTTVRALESAAREGFRSGWRETELFVTPGFSFRVVDGLLTNFHLPKSSLLVLVAALGGWDLVRQAYLEAVRERYRFYSFGDCMLLYPARHGATVDEPRHSVRRRMQARSPWR